VRAVVRVRSDLASFHMAGPIVDVLHIEQLSCVGLPCPSPPAPVILTIVPDAKAGSVPTYDATLANVQRPPAAGVTPAFQCETGSSTPTAPGMRKCFIKGVVPGVYEADVTAPGAQPQHVRVEVPAQEIMPYECCAAGYEPQALWVYLSGSK